MRCACVAKKLNRFASAQSPERVFRLEPNFPCASPVTVQRARRPHLSILATRFDNYDIIIAVVGVDSLRQEVQQLAGKLCARSICFCIDIFEAVQQNLFYLHRGRVNTQ